MFELALEMRDRVGRVVDAKLGAVAFYSDLGFKPIELVNGALGDRPEPVTLLLPIGKIDATVKEAMQHTR
jgi:hypothetical protein